MTDPTTPAPTMTDERIARLRLLLAGAAALPWTADNRETWDRVVWSSQPAGDPELVFNVGQPFVRVGDPCGAADETHCNLIAEGITALPDLLDALQAKTEECDLLRATVRLCPSCVPASEENAQLRAALAEAQKDTARWTDYAIHLAHCGECASSAMHCARGQEFRDACFDNTRADGAPNG